MNQKRSVFVGGAHTKLRDTTGSNEWLAGVAPKVKALGNFGPIPAELEGAVFETFTATREGIYWSVSVDLEKAEGNYLHARGFDPWNLKKEQAQALREEFRELVKPFVEKVNGAFNNIWQVIDAAPEGISYSGTPPMVDAMRLVLASVKAEPLLGEAKCPLCGTTTPLDGNHVMMGRHWYPCSKQGCPAIFIDDYTVDLPFPDGTHRATQSEIKEETLAQLFMKGKDDEEAFHVFGPVEDWKKGESRVYLYVRSGTAIGYSMWNTDEDTGHVILRQIWVQKEFRRQGIGTALLKVEAEGVEEFGVESPNENSTALIEASGLANRCFVVPGM